MKRLDAVIPETCVLEIGTELRARPRVAVIGSETLDEEAIPLAEVVLLSERVVIRCEFQVTILEFSPTTRV